VHGFLSEKKNVTTLQEVVPQAYRFETFRKLVKAQYANCKTPGNFSFYIT